MTDRKINPRILIIYFSLSGQTRGLINLLALGMRSTGAYVAIEKLQPLEKIVFPFNGIIQTLWRMITTFFGLRVLIHELSPLCFDDYDLIVLAGPTWSYNPSGPVLYLIDHYGKRLFHGQAVLPLISCRGYYRIHNMMLRRKLKQCGARLEQSLIFSHPVKEPWSTIGVFLKSAGYQPQRLNILKNHYPHYGHTTKQFQQSRDEGINIALRLQSSAVQEKARAETKQATI